VPAQNFTEFSTINGFEKNSFFGTINCTFYPNTTNNPAIEPGSYRVVVPEGFIMLYATDVTADNAAGADFSYNKEMTINWTIEGSGTTTTASYDPTGISPSTSVEQKSLQTFILTWPDNYKVNYLGDEDNSGNVTSGDEDVAASEERNISIYNIYGDDNIYYPVVTSDGTNSVKLQLSEAITEHGTYFLTIPKNKFEVTTAGGSTGKNTEVTYSYSVPLPDVGRPIAYPAEGTYEEFPLMTVDYEGNVVTDENSTATTYPALFVLKMPEGVTLTKMPSAQYPKWCPLDENGNYDKNNYTTAFKFKLNGYTSTEVNAGKSGGAILISDYYGSANDFCPAPGNYALVLPAQCFKTYDGYNAEMAFYFTVTANNNITYTIEPTGEGSVESLKTIKITFPELADGEDINMRAGYYATVSDEYTNYLMDSEIDGNTITFSVFDTEITTEGNWTFSVPTTGFTVGSKAPFISQTYTIADSNAVVYEITPSNSESVTSIEYFDINFPAFTSLTVSSQNNIGTLQYGNETYTLSAGQPNEGSASVRVSVEGDAPLTAEGNYLLNINAGAFLLSNGESNVSSPAISVLYVVEAEKTFAEVARPEIDPAEGEVSEFTSFNLTVEKAVTVGSNKVADLYICNDDNSLRSVVANFLASAGENGNTVKLTNMGGEGMALNLTDGKYALVTPEGMFTVDGLPSESYTYAYTLKADTGVATIALDATEGYTIYTTTGICLANKGGVEAVNALNAGLYIINGKKVIVRK
jgi:hypothetical protein